MRRVKGQTSNVARATGPNWYVVAAIVHRMHEWEKEQEQQKAQALALKMRAKSSGKHLAISSQQKEGKI